MSSSTCPSPQRTSLSRLDDPDMEKAMHCKGASSDGWGDLSDPSQTPPLQAQRSLQKEPMAMVLDWDGPSDPDDPMNWRPSKKIFHTFVVSAVCVTCTIASSIYTPGQQSVQDDFHVSYEVALLPYVLFTLGLACGPMVSAPISEHFGRRAVFLTGMPIFALFTLGSGFANGIVSLTVCRFLAGIFASPPLAIGSAAVSDLYRPSARAIPMAIYVTTPFLGPALGPLLGGFVVEAFSWRWTQWTLLFCAAASLAPVWFMKETFSGTILRRRAKDRGVVHPDLQRSRQNAAWEFVHTLLVRPFHMAVVEPVVGLYTLYIALNIGMTYAFFGAFPYVFETVYGFDVAQIGLTFLGLAGGTLVGCGFMVLFSHTVYARQVVRSKEAGAEGRVRPEERLWFGMIASILIPISLFWFGWTARADVHWIWPVLAEGVYGMGSLFAFMSAVLYIMDFYGPVYGASAMAVNNVARYLLGAAFPLFIVQMYKGLGIGWASSLLGFVSLGMTPIPWAFYIWGPQLRERTRYVCS